MLQIIFCSCVVETTLSCENGGSVPRAGRECFDIFSCSRERWSNDKTIIEFVYRKILWFVNVSQINYLSQPSANHNISGLLIGCSKTWEILRHFQGKLCGKKGLLCGKLCDFFKADLTLFFRSQRRKPIFLLSHGQLKHIKRR